ncbi:MAG: protein involved in biosynthesis of mitomycin antibiotics/polyketide fumonisin [Acidimicrobiales bacterium]|nr:protein involved in biosynthesis of mitomycin antibiotics/polyketide fumonisin [Acidimicrobiales bacterium]
MRVADGLTAQQRYFFDLNGYLVLEGAVGAEDVAYMNSLIEAQRLPPPASSIESQRFGDEFLRWDRVFRDLLDHEAVLPLLRDLVGDHVRLDHAYGIVMAPNTAGLGLHGGGMPLDPSQYYLHRGGRMYNGLTTVTWSLVDSSPGEGGFGCIPGSHKADEPLPPEIPTAWIREVPLPAGSVLIFTEALTHCTIPWTASIERRAVLFKYSPGHMAWAPWRDPPRALWRSLTDRQRRLFQAPAVSPHDPV